MGCGAGKPNNTNFLRKTLEVMQVYGKTPEDVRAVLVRPYWHWERDRGDKWQKGNWEDFACLADRPYNIGFTIDDRDPEAETGVKQGLMIIGDDWWMERDYADEFGTEWWTFKTLPIPPDSTEPLKSFIDKLQKYEEDT